MVLKSFFQSLEKPIVLLAFLFFNFFACYANAENLHGNIKSLIFHNNACKYYACKNCVKIFTEAQEALEAGYRPCKLCRNKLAQQDGENSRIIKTPKNKEDNAQKLFD